MKQRIYRAFVELSNNPFQSKLLKKFAQSKLSKPIIPSFYKTFQINLEEAEKNIGEYKSLHEFFIRRLKREVRPINQQLTTVVSPVDAKVAAFGDIDQEQNFYVKEQYYSLNELLGSKQKAEEFQRGSFLILYLSPRDYHRIHSPLDATINQQQTLGGNSYPVNDAGLKYGKRPLSRNYRVITELEDDGRKCLVIKVGAMNINTIEVTHSEQHIKRGEELGYFSFGSTVILLFEENFVTFDDVKVNQFIQMGQPIAFKK
ncbi:phosphatidylserine decarboxylase [Bacillus sp. TS-2]|nr:phosphatidylserine decarboxylase [Bacillus sp. TS-2]